VQVRIRQAAAINSSLLSLKSCIRAKCRQERFDALPQPAAKAGKSGSKSSGHIPYRETPLTRILQDSFKGSFACLQPSRFATWIRWGTAFTPRLNHS
jgi:hypothetical protein